MKIGLDIDGVILDYERVVKTYGELYDLIELNGEGIQNKQEAYLKDRYNWTPEQRQNFIDKYFLELTNEANLMPCAKKVIDMLKKDGHELIIISARGGMVEEMTDAAMKRFEEEGLKFDKYYFKKWDKLETVQKENIDVMIDDSYKVCNEISSNNIKTIYFREKDMKKLEENEYLKEVSNWGEIYRYIKNIEK